MSDDSTTILSYSGFIIGVLSIILGAINHKRIRSNCFGRNVVMSVDVENTTPPIKTDNK